MKTDITINGLMDGISVVEKDNTNMEPATEIDIIEQSTEESEIKDNEVQRL